MEPSRKRIEEILSMPEKELSEYLRETDSSLQKTDLVRIVPFEHGIKALYYHMNSPKPFKTKVYLKSLESSDPLK